MRPNLVLFIPDQLSVDAVGAFGNPIAQTPHIDALAARGTLFTNAFGQHSVCSPSRVSFLTGWYPHVSGHRTLTHLIKPWEPNLLRILRDAGYHSVFAGMRGDTFAPDVARLSCDYSGYEVEPMVRRFTEPVVERESPMARAHYHGLRQRHLDENGVALDFDEAVIRTAEKLLADGLPEPFVLFVPLMFPHVPFEVEEPWFSMHSRADMPAPAPVPSGGPAFLEALRTRHGWDRLGASDFAELSATYYGMVSRVDDQLGRVVRAVDSAGAADRTAWMFFPDHGEYLGDYGVVEKWTSGLSDNLVHNPLIIATPQGAEGQRVDAMVELVDLLPTACDLAEVTVGHTHFGRSLLPLIADPSATHRDAAFSEGGFALAEAHLVEQAGYPYDIKAAIQQEDVKLAGRAVAMRTRDWTYIHRLYEPDELYDRAADPNECTNLAGTPEAEATMRDLRSAVLEWLFSTSDVIPWQNDPRFEPEFFELLSRGASKAQTP
jgi:arylsulfatase A-like enzyme